MQFHLNQRGKFSEASVQFYAACLVTCIGVGSVSA
jgi:hypothetical protein